MTEFMSEIARHASARSVVWAVLLIIFGMLAIGSPRLAALALNVVIAWLLVMAGVVHLFIAFHAHGAGSIVWKLLVGVAYLGFGLYLLMHPVLGVISLTLVLAALFLVEGILDIILFFKMRLIPGAEWVLFDGIVTLLCGLLLYLGWPSNSVWAIGILVGASMILTGITRIMLSFTARKVVAKS